MKKSERMSLAAIEGFVLVACLILLDDRIDPDGNTLPAWLLLALFFTSVFVSVVGDVVGCFERRTKETN